jgi:3',5'-cyclic AMP phosphodiesterase CpdA
MKIVHLSDLHFHRDKKDNKKALTTLKNVQTKFPHHYVVISGDIVDDGHETQYENAFNALKQFEGRVFIAPGNHDFGALGNFYSKERAERFDDMLATPLKQGGTFSAENKPVVNVVRDGSDVVMFIALDTNLETEHPFDFACGEVGDTQLDALYRILENSAAPGMTKVLFFHHHPFVRNDPFMALTDAGKLARVVYNKVEVILFGHKHVMGKWEHCWDVRYILASDNSPGKSKAGEITIENGIIKVDYVDI